MRWKDIESRSERENITPKMIFREELQKAILTSFSKEGLFQRIVFQGGTALRLFYDNPRYSEDLDFVLREEHPSVKIADFLKTTKDFIAYSYPFLEEVKTRTQKAEDDLQRYIIKTTSKNPEQAVRINIELYDVPSYMNETKILSFSPFQPAVRVEKPEEILADKVAALSGRKYIKGRDLWDIYFLTEQKNLSVDLALLLKKIKDYDMDEDDFIDELTNIEVRLEKEGKDILDRELKRFLSPSLYQYYHGDLDTVLTRVNKTARYVSEELSGGGSH